MNWYKKNIFAQFNQPFYHGGQCNIEKFTLDFLGTGAGQNQQGPGLYFTSSENNARRYGPCVHKLSLKPTGKVLTDKAGTNRSVPRKDIESIILRGQIGNLKTLLEMRQNNGIATHLSNYHQNPKLAFKLMVDSIIFGNYNGKQVAQSICEQAFKGEQQQFVNQMRVHGYDMLLVKKNSIGQGGCLHAIVYNPSIIKDLGIINDEGDLY